jgi:hypothetical protein
MEYISSINIFIASRIVLSKLALQKDKEIFFASKMDLFPLLIFERSSTFSLSLKTILTSFSVESYPGECPN